MASRHTTTLLENDLNANGHLLNVDEREQIFTSIVPKARPRTSCLTSVTQTHLKRKPIREFLTRCIHAFLYNLMHIIYAALSTLSLAYSFVFQNLIALRYIRHRTPLTIETDIEKLPRLPRHLSIILDSTGAAQDSLVMARLIDQVCQCAAWAACAGIQVLSIYERQGVLKAAQPQLHQYISRTLSSYYGTDSAKPTVSLRSPLMPAFSPPSTSPDLQAQGGRPSRHLSIIMLSEQDGRRTLVDLAKTLAEMSQKRRISPKDISAELIDAEISESVMDEPDLVILFGGQEINLRGYPPWQIRLSEIYHVPAHVGVKYHAFLRGLQKYAGAQFRFGT